MEGISKNLAQFRKPEPTTEEYKIEITSDIDANKDYKAQRSKAFKEAIIAISLIAIVNGGLIASAIYQDKKFEEGMKVVYSETLPNGITFNLQRNGMGYVTDENGNSYAEINGINGQEIADKMNPEDYIKTK